MNVTFDCTPEVLEAKRLEIAQYVLEHHAEFTQEARDVEVTHPRYARHDSARSDHAPLRHLPRPGVVSASAMLPRAELRRLPRQAKANLS